MYLYWAKACQPVVISSLRTNHFGRVRADSEMRLLPSSCVRLFVRLSVRMYHQRGSHWMDFREIWYWRLLQKSVEEHQISSKSDNNIGALHVDYSQLYNNAKGTNSCVSMTTLNDFILLATTCESTIQGESTVASPWQVGLWERAMTSHYTYNFYLVLGGHIPIKT